LAHAVEAEVSSFIDAHADHRLTDGRARIVHLPERNIQTGIGAVRVQQPRVRDRADEEFGRCFARALVKGHIVRELSKCTLVLTWA